MIYIATNEHGRGIKHITAFSDRMDFLNYADNVLMYSDGFLAKSSKISAICEALSDMGIGFGARDHKRVNRQDAKKYIREGAKAVSC